VSVYERLTALNIGRCGDRVFVLPYSVRRRQIWMACERLERAALSRLGGSDGISHHGLTEREYSGRHIHAAPPLGGYEMTERNAEASPRPRARITGIVYLLYFLTAVSAEVFVGRSRLVLCDAVNLIAYPFYIAVTLLCYYLFKPVNGNLSLLTAFSLLGCAK